MSGAPAAAAPPRITACALRIEPFYSWRDAAPRRCVATVMTVDIANIAADASYVGVPPHVFPFGLLESIIVLQNDGGSDTSVPPAAINIKPVTLEFSRLVMSGTAKGPAVAYGERTTLTVGALNVDEDAQHEDLRTVRELTGHDFRFRAVSAATLLALKVHFDTTLAPAPASIRIEFWGMNVLPEDCSLAVATAALAANAPVKFVLPAIPPKQRFEAAAATMSALRTAAAATTTS